jgi:hypothetical protein
VCGTTIPVSGPYRPYANDGSGGLTFTYLDTSAVGAVLDPATASASQIGRIRVTVRAQTESPVDAGGSQARSIGDSLVITVGLRNRY